MNELFGRLWGAMRDMWPRSGEIALPVRVTEAIEQNDDKSEILVKVIQFFVFALWGIAYLAAPQPNPETTSLVPSIISAYLLITLILLLIALTRRTPVWLIFLSIVFDMALLTFLIWSFHIQYGQPASFALKVVEVMNFFVLISLRALRFEARYVIAAGLTAVVCWIALVGYVIKTDPSDPMITRDYITYLTSNSVLIGAEVSKMISIIMVTAVLAIAVRRGHVFLVRSVAEGSAAQDLSRFMPSSVAQQIRGAEHKIEAGQGMRRDAAILNIDVRGFTQLVAKMAPHDAMQLLSDYQHQVVPIAHRHGGVIDKFMGDGIMITFGAENTDDAYCANALRCVDELLVAQEKWTGPAANLNINMAATAGPVIFGAVGDGDRLEFTVIGPSVNFSAKLEKQNKVLGTKALISAYCYQQALKQGYQKKGSPKLLSTVVGDDTEPTKVVVIA